MFACKPGYYKIKQVILTVICTVVIPIAIAGCCLYVINNARKATPCRDCYTLVIKQKSINEDKPIEEIKIKEIHTLSLKNNMIIYVTHNDNIEVYELDANLGYILFQQKEK